MNYNNVPTSVNAGLTAVPASGAALGSLWLVLLGITLIMVAFAVSKLLPREES